MKNAFFYQALNKTSFFFGRNERVVLLLSQLSARLGSINRNELSFTSVKEKINVLIRLVKTYSTGAYKAVSWKVIASILAAFIYFVNPFDLVPDFAPIVGYTDDFSILLWVYNSVQTELDKFLLWEKSQLLA